MVEKFKKSFKYIKIEDIFAIFIFFMMLVPSIFFKIFNKLKKRKILLIIENGYTARDNGYHFFKYVREEHPNDYCYYVINKKCLEYEKVKKFGNIIQYKSLKHWLYYMSAKYNISNHKMGNPNSAFFYVLHVFLGLYNNRVFLQHGITVSDAKWLYYKNTKFKYFICGAKDEYNFIKDKFGYPEKNVVYTGFARFDNLNNNYIRNQILIMPTWRNWLGRKTNMLEKKVVFEETEYFQRWNSLLNNNLFIDYVESNNLEVLFYPHINMCQFIDYFNVKSNNFKILESNYDIQKALKESFVMITDYSSVFMDFAYMNKPIIFYQFDYELFRKMHYQEGYYDYKNGFGPALNEEDDVINCLINIIENGLDKKYYDRMKNFFELRDLKNCERIYEILK